MEALAIGEYMNFNINKRDMEKFESQGLCSGDMLDELAYLGAELISNILITKNSHDREGSIYNSLAALQVATELYVKIARMEGRFKVSLFEDMLKRELDRVKSQGEDCNRISFMPKENRDW